MNKEELGFDAINLGHGSGGLMTRDLLDKIIFKTFSNPFLDQKHDGSIVKFDGPIAISTDSFVVSPIFFKGGNSRLPLVVPPIPPYKACTHTPARMHARTHHKILLMNCNP